MFDQHEEGLVSQRACAWGVELGCGDIVGVGVERIFSSESCELVLIVFCMLGDVVTVVVERFFDLDPMIVNMGGIRSYLTDKCECLSVDVVVMVMFVLNLSAERNRKDLTLEYNKMQLRDTGCGGRGGETSGDRARHCHQVTEAPRGLRPL